MIWWLPWYTPRSEKFKLKSCQNLIQHYLGNFLKHQLTLDQLSVNIYNGIGRVCNISLDCEALNELGKQHNWPIKVVESHMEDITIRIPWKNLLENDSIFKINGLSVTVQPKARNEPVTSILRWMLSNWPMLRKAWYILPNTYKEDETQEPGTGQAPKLFGESLNAILRRLKVKMENTKIRFEHVPKDIDQGFIFEFNIKNIDYYDETNFDVPTCAETERSKTYKTKSFGNKSIKFEGVTLHMQIYEDEVKRSQKAQHFDDDHEMNMASPERQVSDLFGIQYGNCGHDTETRQTNEIGGVLKYAESGKLAPVEKISRPDVVLFSTLNEQQGLTLSYKDADETEQPKLKFQTIGPFIIVLSPNDLDSVYEIIKSLHGS